MRVGLLTAGGDCPGLNAALRAVGKTLIHRGEAELVGFEDGFLGLIEGRWRPLTWRDLTGIVDLGGTILGTDNRADPFRYFGRGGADVSGEVVDCCRDLDLAALVVVGGEGSMTVAARLDACGLPVVGVPKTIDNDVWGTERTIGFETAVATAAEAIARVHTTAQSHHRVFVIETMGRHAGWIALYAAVAGAADVVLLPEIDFDLDEIARVCRERDARGQRFTIVVAAEGSKPIGGEVAIRERVEQSAEPVRLGGIGRRVAAELRERLSDEVRSIDLGHVLRGGPPTPGDRVLASALGGCAADLVLTGRGGRMAAVAAGRVTSVRLLDVGGRSRSVPFDSPVLRATLGMGTSVGVAAPPVVSPDQEPSATI